MLAITGSHETIYVYLLDEETGDMIGSDCHAELSEGDRLDEKELLIFEKSV